MLMDTERSSSLDAVEIKNFELMIQAAKIQVEPEQRKIQKKYVEDEAPLIIEAAQKKGGNLSFEDAKKTVQARCEGGKHRDQYKDDILIFDKFGAVSVADALENLEKYDQATLRDPQEPELGRGKAKLYFNKEEQKPCIHSFVHGGIKYFLHPEPVGTEFLEEVETVEDVLDWIESTDDNRKILKEWLPRVKPLDINETEDVKQAVQAKTKAKISILNKQLKNQQAEWRREQRQKDRTETSRKRQKIGIAEIMYYATTTGKCCHDVSQALRNHKEHKIYRYGGELIKIVNKPPTTVRMVKKLDDIGLEYPSMPVITHLGVETLTHEVEKVAVCQVESEDGNQDIPWPKNIMKGVLALTEGHEKNLVGIVEHPYIDYNFNPVVTPGYDDETGLYKSFNGKIQDVFPDAATALEYLIDEVFQDFVFATPLDRMAAVSCLLAGMQRRLIADNSGCPGYLFTAPVQSSGKTTLVQIISYSLYNRPMAASTFSDDDTEMAKHLLGILQEGHSSILFDNIQEGAVIESNELAKAITSDSYSNRWLGKNKTVTVPSSVLWMFTGNNVSICGDFNTRILPVELDTKEANPDQRKFKRSDIGAWCEQNREKILSACMKVIMGAKNFKPNVNPSRFPSWDRFVRFPLLKTAGYDVAEIFQKNKLADPKIEGQENFFEAWYVAFGSTPTTAKQIINHCRLISDAEKYGFSSSDDNELAMAVKDIFPGGGLPTTRALGKWLGGMKNRFFGDYRLSSAGKGSNRNQKGQALWVIKTQSKKQIKGIGSSLPF